MYKDLGTILIAGSTGTGKSFLIKKYIDEVLQDKNNFIIIIDPKMVEFFAYKNKENVKYIDNLDELDDNFFASIKNSDKKIYLFVDEYAEIKCIDNLHKKFKEILYNRQETNTNVIFASQRKDCFCNGMKKSANTVITLNSHR